MLFDEDEECWWMNLDPNNNGNNWNNILLCPRCGAEISEHSAVHVCPLAPVSSSARALNLEPDLGPLTCSMCDGLVDCACPDCDLLLCNRHALPSREGFNTVGGDLCHEHVCADALNALVRHEHSPLLVT